MAIRLLYPTNGRSILDWAPSFLAITFLAIFLVMGTVSCGTAEEGVEAVDPPGGIWNCSIANRGSSRNEERLLAEAAVSR